MASTGLRRGGRKAGCDTVAIEAKNAKKALATASSLINDAHEAIGAMLQAKNSRVSDLEERLAHANNEVEKFGGRAAVSDVRVAQLEEDLTRANEEVERLRVESQANLDRAIASEHLLEEERSMKQELQADLEKMRLTNGGLTDQANYLLRLRTAEHTDAINALQSKQARVQELEVGLKKPKLAIAVLQVDRIGYHCYVTDHAVDFRSVLEASAHDTNQSPSRLVASSCVDGTTLNNNSVMAPCDGGSLRVHIVSVNVSDDPVAKRPRTAYDSDLTATQDD